MLGVVKVWVMPAPDVASGDPPLAAAYQLNMPDVSELTYRSTVPVPHRLLSVVVKSLITDARTTVRGNVMQAPLSNST
jgi:hypothetical protein